MDKDIEQIFSLIDLTSLNNQDNASTIAALCEKIKYRETFFAAVCVFPQFVSQVKEVLKSTPVKVATVANFPGGMDSLNVILKSIESSIDQGATEIDVVFPYPYYLKGEKNYALDVILACKKMCGKNSLLKVILETGALIDDAKIQEVSESLILNGADFLKTSTGKIAQGRTLDAASIMLQTIKKHGGSVGFKASGGIRTLSQAKEYIALVKTIMGDEWITPAHLRFGTSHLVTTLLNEKLAFPANLC